MLRATLGYGTWEDPVGNKSSHNSGFPLYKRRWPQWIRNDLIRVDQNSTGFTEQAAVLSVLVFTVPRTYVFVSEGCSWRTRGSLALRKRSSPGRGQGFWNRTRQGRTWRDLPVGQREAAANSRFCPWHSSPQRAHAPVPSKESHLWWE